MRRAILLLGFAACVARGAAADAGALAWLSPTLRAVELEQAALRTELAALGTPVVGQTVAEFGYMHTRLAAAPPTSPWVQVDLGQAQPLDWIALVPAQVDWQPVGGPAYGFPRRFRIDASDDIAFATFAPIAVFTDSDFPEPGIAPVAVRAGGRRARYVRVTAVKLAVENAQHFFALAELMVVSGKRNIAVGRPVQASAAVNLPPRWSAANLTDGRTPLGPPVQRELLPYDGLYAGDGTFSATAAPLWMQVDLGRPYPLQEVRLHPVHARLGADIPGFAFPSRFRLEAADEPEFAAPTVLFDAGTADFPNPGNNAVTVRTDGVTARYVRFRMVEPSRAFGRNRFGLSEIEVFSGGANVARQGTVEAVADPAAMSRGWPRQQLVDGFTSYGRLIELPDWLAGWQRRTELGARLATLDARRRTLVATSQRRLAWSGGGLGLVLLAGAGVWVVRQRRRRARELEVLRTRLARDLHDEIGSNLAGLAMLSETAGGDGAADDAAREDWREVNRIARESTDAMREVLWVVGAREEAGIDLTAQLQKTAARVLPGRRVAWDGPPALPPDGWSAEARRQVFLFFKEALANVARHARAQEVRLAAGRRDGAFELSIADDGCGFDPAKAAAGIGLASLRERARTLGGTCTIDSAPGKGTRVTLRVPE